MTSLTRFGRLTLHGDQGVILVDASLYTSWPSSSSSTSDVVGNLFHRLHRVPRGLLFEDMTHWFAHPLDPSLGHVLGFSTRLEVVLIDLADT